MIQSDQLPLQEIGIATEADSERTFWASLIAVTIVGAWTASTVLLLSIDLSKLPVLMFVPALIWQTFLYTGLFITAHDAMHGVAFPQSQKINNFIGSLTLKLYGFLSYKDLLKKHWIHHKHPASQLDPDFHDGIHKGPCAWYFHFMKGYWSWTQIVVLTVIFNLANRVLHVPEINLILFWAIPPILSSMQLFYFGTFLTHREPEGGYDNPHRAHSNALSIFWSFVTCYHFGYHREHHEYPRLAWWQLPTVYWMQADPT